MPASVVSSTTAASTEPAPYPTGRAGSDRWGPRDGLTLWILCGCVFVLSALRGAVHPFWSDEVATARIAGAPTWHDTLLRSRMVDIHPPLEPLLVRLSFHLFGPHEFAGHLPSVIAYTIAIGSLFVFLRRRLGLLYSVFGALLLLCNTDVFVSAMDARPYGLLLGSVCLAVAAYDSVVQGIRPVLARVLLALALAVMLQAHLFGTFAAGAFIAAEAVRTIRLRRLDVATWVAVLLPWMTCLSYIPLLRIQAAQHGSPMVYKPEQRTSFKLGVLFFYEYLGMPLGRILKLTVVLLLCVPFFPRTNFFRYSRVTWEHGALFVMLLASSLFVTGLLHVRAPESPFYYRYGIAAVCPAILVAAGVIAWRAGEHRLAGFVLLAAALLGSAATLAEVPHAVVSVAHNGLTAEPAGLNETGGVETVCPNLPLVMVDALEFLEADYRLSPSTEPGMVYLSDKAAALRLEHANAGESVEGMSRAFATPHHVLAPEPFLSEHPDFLLLTNPRRFGWFWDALQEEHARVQPLGPVTFAGSKDRLWLVTQPGKGPFAAAPGCPAH